VKLQKSNGAVKALAPTLPKLQLQLGPKIILTPVAVIPPLPPRILIIVANQSALVT